MSSNMASIKLVSWREWGPVTTGVCLNVFIDLHTACDPSSSPENLISPNISIHSTQLCSKVGWCGPGWPLVPLPRSWHWCGTAGTQPGSPAEDCGLARWSQTAVRMDCRWIPVRNPERERDTGRGERWLFLVC